LNLTLTTSPSPAFSRTDAAPVCLVCQAIDGCKADKEKDAALVVSVGQRTKKLIGWDVTDPSGADGGECDKNWTACQSMASEMGPRIQEFQKYSDALPYARAASDVNKLGDSPGSQSGGGKCITRLSDSAQELNKQLDLKPGTITDEDLRNDKTGFRAGVYRSDYDGSLILVPRDTEPNSLVDWKTNTDNGQGKYTDQYAEMRNLTGILNKSRVKFNLAGYSKGGGLAQEGGLVNPDAKVVVFNSAGIPEASVGRTAPTSLDSLADRTQSFSSEGDFLTYMNNTTDPTKQIENARFLLSRLSGHGMIDPISIDYSNPATLAAKQARENALQRATTMEEYGLSPSPDVMAAAAKDPDPALVEDRKQYLDDLKNLIDQKEKEAKEGKPVQLFPPVRTDDQETVPGSMSKTGWLLGAGKDEANLGKLAQHQMSNVLDPMEKLVDKDRRSMQQFLEKCG
jgi:hypothetical protein